MLARRLHAAWVLPLWLHGALLTLLPHLLLILLATLLILLTLVLHPLLTLLLLLHALLALALLLLPLLCPHTLLLLLLVLHPLLILLTLLVAYALFLLTAGGIVPVNSLACLLLTTDVLALTILFVQRLPLIIVVALQILFLPHSLFHRVAFACLRAIVIVRSVFTRCIRTLYRLIACLATPLFNRLPTDIFIQATTQIRRRPSISSLYPRRNRVCA